MQLIRALMPEFRAGQRADQGLAGFRYLKTRKLGDRLGLGEEGVRQLVRV